MKMQYSMWVKGRLEVIEAKNEYQAFHKAIAKFGFGNFYGFKRRYPNQNERDHKLHLLKRAISNVTKHLHKENRHKNN